MSDPTATTSTVSATVPMLRKIDCIMMQVADLAAAVEYYQRVFGLRVFWQRERSVGLTMPETDAEIVLHIESDIPGPVEPYYLVDDVVAAAAFYTSQGCSVLVEPFDIEIGTCAVLQDPFGVRLCILDMSKGPLAAE